LNNNNVHFGEKTMCWIIGVADLNAAVKKAVATIKSTPAPINAGFAAEPARAQAPLAFGARAEAARRRRLARDHVIVGLLSQQH
jgi:hypothetical protein